MTSLLVRMGALESRLGPQLLWNSGKGKRADWVCAECRGRRTLRQMRLHNDDTSKAGRDVSCRVDVPQREAAGKEIIRGVKSRTSPYRRSQRLRSWRLEDEESSEGVAERRAVLSDAEESQKYERNVSGQEFEPLKDDDTGAPDEPQVSGDARPGLDRLNVDYASRLLPALGKNDSNMVARCLYAAEKNNDMDFIRSIPATTFADCIRVLSPSNTTEELTSIHAEINEGMSRSLGITNSRKLTRSHSDLLLDILRIRRSSGIKIEITEYAILLRSARDLGSLEMSTLIWDDLLEDGLTPDTACYNYRMGAYVWNKVHDPRSRQNSRVVPFHMEARRVLAPGPEFANYRVGDAGLKSTVMLIFRAMLRDGVEPDEESHWTVITAAAREGDLTTVKSVLRLVWGIDVDVLLAGNEADMTLKEVDKTSPLSPTPTLLSTLAHAFGINNDIPAALRLVDFVARKYDIPIDMSTWGQLLEWTFVLAQYRTGSKVDVLRTRKGELPKRSVLDLWETMIGAPYFVKPTMAMYDRVVKTLYYRGGSTREMYEKMIEAMEIYHESCERVSNAMSILKNALERERQRPGSHKGRSPQTLRREWELLYLTRKRNEMYVIRWLRLLLRTMESWIGHDNSLDWSLRTIPSLLWELKEHAPKLVSYSIYGGLVDLQMRTNDEDEHRERALRGKKETAWNVVKKACRAYGEEWVFRKIYWERDELDGDKELEGKG